MTPAAGHINSTISMFEIPLGICVVAEEMSLSRQTQTVYPRVNKESPYCCMIPSQLEDFGDAVDKNSALAHLRRPKAVSVVVLSTVELTAPLLYYTHVLRSSLRTSSASYRKQ